MASVSSVHTWPAEAWVRRRGLEWTNGLVGSVADFLAHELVHPVVGLVILSAVGRETGDDERHVGGFLGDWIGWLADCCGVSVGSFE